MARGADFESGNLFSKAKALIPILIPLLVSSFRRADELADAMDARCYSGGKTRTKYKQFHLTFNDLLAVLCMVALFTLIVLANNLAI
ncbi:MAG: energy-coupling factor transporter transmembrane protein EcfT, partial [Clostridia bacterium]|nr:energy-coupling factor transporter transmembrane protein EcfT [Clostridia bacterium]